MDVPGMDMPTETQRRVFGEGITKELIDSFSQGDVNNNSCYESDIDSSFENDIYVSDAQQQWEENMKQLEVAVFFVLCPIFGRLIGRKAAHSIWIRFVTWRWKSAQTNNILDQFAITK